MDVKRARSPRAANYGDDDDDKRRAPRWGGAVRPSMVLLGFLITLALLALVFGGRSGSLPPTSPSSSAPRVDDRHVVDGAGAATTTPESKLLLFCLVVSARVFDL